MIGKTARVALGTWLGLSSWVTACQDPPPPPAPPPATGTGEGSGLGYVPPAGGNYAANNGSEPSGSPSDAAPVAALAFADISAAVTNDCGGPSCHSQGGNLAVYDDNEPGFDGDVQNIISQLNAGTMPQNGNISASDKQLILAYATQVAQGAGGGANTGAAAVSGSGSGVGNGSGVSSDTGFGAATGTGLGTGP
jgi:hypothetical protein